MTPWRVERETETAARLAHADPEVRPFRLTADEDESAEEFEQRVEGLMQALDSAANLNSARMTALVMVSTGLDPAGRAQLALEYAKRLGGANQEASRESASEVIKLFASLAAGKKTP